MPVLVIDTQPPSKLRVTDSVSACEEKLTEGLRRRDAGGSPFVRFTRWEGGDGPKLTCSIDTTRVTHINAVLGELVD